MGPGTAPAPLFGAIRLPSFTSSRPQPGARVSGRPAGLILRQEAAPHSGPNSGPTEGTCITALKDTAGLFSCPSRSSLCGFDIDIRTRLVLYNLMLQLLSLQPAASKLARQTA